MYHDLLPEVIQWFKFVSCWSLDREVMILLGEYPSGIMLSKSLNLLRQAMLSQISPGCGASG